MTLSIQKYQTNIPKQLKSNAEVAQVLENRRAEQKERYVNLEPNRLDTVGSRSLYSPHSFLCEHDCCV